MPLVFNLPLQIRDDLVSNEIGVAEPGEILGQSISLSLVETSTAFTWFSILDPKGCQP